MVTCKIKWINGDGNQTPDSNPAVGMCRCKAHVSLVHGRAIKHDDSEWFPICAEHAKRLGEPGMHNWELMSLDEMERQKNTAEAQGFKIGGFDERMSQSYRDHPELFD